jgi:sugar (pentulose or hexulose) kinase
MGIDVGTSYTKGAARARNGECVAVYRVRSPRFEPPYLIGPGGVEAWWSCIEAVARGLLTARSREMRTIAICISAIAPTLILFDGDRRQASYALMYSWLPDGANGEGLVQCDPELTRQRVTTLKSIALNQCLTRPCITDLVGYANWRLTNELTINAMTCAEMGMAEGSMDSDMLAVGANVWPRVVAVGDRIGGTTAEASRALGVAVGVPVCGGCPDTVGDIVGAGLRHAAERMLYLGTFGSLLRLEADIEPLLAVHSCAPVPFRWSLSVPDLGPEIETASNRWFRGPRVEQRLRALDEAASRARPGAGGTLLLVPRWKNGSGRNGGFEFVPDERGAIGDTERQARAALEGLGYAILAAAPECGEPLRAAGGGARSHIWLDALSTVLGQEVQACEMASEAIGTADIAARLAWNEPPPARSIYRSVADRAAARDVIDRNCYRAKERYREQGWL